MFSPATLLIVRDLTQSQAFYQEILGFTLIEQTKNAIKFDIGGHQVFMFQGGKTAINYQHSVNASSTLVLKVENLKQKMVELKSKGVHFIHEIPNENQWGQYAAFSDPSGIVIEMMEFNAN